MTTTFLQLAADALLALGVVGEENPPTAGQAQLALRVFNRLCDAYVTNRLLVYSLTRTVTTMVSGQATYTVGTGANIDIPRPVNWEANGCNATFINTSTNPTQELPLYQLTDDAFQSIVQKAFQATYPTSYYYNPTYTSASPYGSLSLYPVPNVSYLQLVTYTPSQFGEFAITDTISMPQGYQRFFWSNMAVELEAFFPAVRASEKLTQIAMESKGDVERMNLRMVELDVDPALWPVPQSINFYSGSGPNG